MTRAEKQLDMALGWIFEHTNGIGEYVKVLSSIGLNEDEVRKELVDSCYLEDDDVEDLINHEFAPITFEDVFVIDVDEELKAQGL